MLSQLKEGEVRAMDGSYMLLSSKYFAIESRDDGKVSFVSTRPDGVEIVNGRVRYADEVAQKFYYFHDGVKMFEMPIVRRVKVEDLK